MKKITLLIIAGMLAILPSFGQVQDTLVANVGANYQANLTKVDWNWARMWVENNSTNGKITHGICVFSASSIISQDINSASFSFYFEKIASGTLPATVEVYYKAPYTGYKSGDVNYPEGCTVLGSIELTTVGMEYSLSNEALKTYVKAQIDAGEDAVLFMRSATTDVKLSMYGNLGYPTLALDVPVALTYAPVASIAKPAASAKDYFISTKDTITLDFTKAMDKTSVESKFAVEPAATSSSFMWQGDTIAFVTCEGISEMTDVTFTVQAGALAADGTATKADKTNTFFAATSGIVKSNGNFWNLSGVSKTNALSIANTDSAESINDRKSFIYFDLTETTSDTDFKGIMLKCFDHQDANGWVKGPIGEDNTDYVLYDVAFSTFGAPFDGTAFDGMKKTKIDDIVVDSTFTVYTYNSQAILDYLLENAGKQVCIAVVDETVTESISKPTIWISDPSNKPNEGAPVVLYSDGDAASLSSVAVNSISIYPQPVNNGVLNFTGLSVSSVEVYSLIGARLMQQNVVANQVNVSTLNGGVYLMKMNTNEGQIVKQFVVE